MILLRKHLFLLITLIVVTFPTKILATKNNDTELKKEVAELREEVKVLRTIVAELRSAHKRAAKTNTTQNAPKAKEKNESIQAPLSAPPVENTNTYSPPMNFPITPTVPSGSPFALQGQDITTLITGGVDAGWNTLAGQQSSFNVGEFNPIILANYKDLLLFRAALSFSLDNQGNTDSSLNFANINFVLNDYAMVGIGKFDSAIGQFTQNLSPAWINKLPLIPIGFDSNQAAPQSDIGLQLRGGFSVSTMKANYILYLANGPQAMVDTAVTGLIDYISTAGFSTNTTGNYVTGGRLGFLPIPNVELGISGAVGKATLIDLADGITQLQKSRNYYVFGADAVYQLNNWNFRGEIVQQQIASDLNSIVPAGGKWQAWYLQSSYRLPKTKWEPVIRYGKTNTVFLNQQQQQLAFGLNYWLTPSAAAKIAYAINRGQTDTADYNTNVFLMQLVFGF